MVKIIESSLFDAREDIICHQVNCQGVMGAGLAKEIVKRYPMVKERYVRLCRAASEPADLLGRVQLIEIGSERFIANIFGQLYYGRDELRRYTSYSALKSAFIQIRQRYSEYSLAFPFGFGCGLANGDWSVVAELIQTYLGNMNVSIYRYDC